MLSVKVFFQKEPVFCISLLLALASCLLVHPDWDYLAYPVADGPQCTPAVSDDGGAVLFLQYGHHQ